MIYAAREMLAFPEEIFVPLKPWRVQGLMFSLNEGSTALHHQGVVTGENWKIF